MPQPPASPELGTQITGSLTYFTCLDQHLQVPLAQTGPRGFIRPRQGMAKPPFTCKVCPVIYPASAEAK
jgi:hypothetical protein